VAATRQVEIYRSLRPHHRCSFAISDIRRCRKFG